MSNELDNIDRALRDVARELLSRCCADAASCASAVDVFDNGISIDAVLNDCEIHADLAIDEIAKRVTQMLRDASDCVVANRLGTARSMIQNAAKLLEVI